MIVKSTYGGKLYRALNPIFARKPMSGERRPTLRRPVQSEGHTSPLLFIVDFDRCARGKPSWQPTEAGGPRGYAAEKKVKGRKRHILTDTIGLLAGAIVDPADVQSLPSGLTRGTATARRAC